MPPRLMPATAGRDYSDMLGFAAELQYYSGYLDTKDQQDRLKVEHAFKSSANRFVFELLKEYPDENEAAEIVSGELEALAASNESPLETALEETRAYLLERISREARKSPRLRAIVRWTPLAIGVAVLIAYFSVRYFSIIDINAPAQSRDGLVQRAAAFEKVRNHDPQGGYSLRALAAKVLLWPLEPTQPEVEAAREFFQLSGEAFSRLGQRNEICVNPFDFIGGATLRQQVEIVHRVANYVRDPNSRWAEPPIETLSIPLRRDFPCR